MSDKRYISDSGGMRINFVVADTSVFVKWLDKAIRALAEPEVRP